MVRSRRLLSAVFTRRRGNDSLVHGRQGVAPSEGSRSVFDITLHGANYPAGSRQTRATTPDAERSRVVYRPQSKASQPPDWKRDGIPILRLQWGPRQPDLSITDAPVSHEYSFDRLEVRLDPP